MKTSLLIAAGIVAFAVWQWRKSLRSAKLHDYLTEEQQRQRIGAATGDATALATPPLQVFVPRPIWNANEVTGRKPNEPWFPWNPLIYGLKPQNN